MTLGQQTFLGQKDIIEPVPQYCQGSVGDMTFPQIEIIGDTVLSWYFYRRTYYVNDSTEIFGYDQCWKHYIEFTCDTIKGCEFWLVDYDKGNEKSKILVLQTPFSDPEYMLDRFGYGMYDRQIRMIVEKEKN